MESATCVMLPVYSAVVQRVRTAPAALRHGSLMMDAVTSAARQGVTPWRGSAISVTTPATSVLMRDLTTAPAVTEIGLTWPGTSFRVSVGMSVQRGSSPLQEDGVKSVPQTASSVPQQTTASTAAQDTSPEMASASRWSAVQVKDAGKVANAEKEDCVPCDEGCKLCERKDSGDQEQGTVCLKCEDDYYQLGTDCHQSCPDRTHSVIDTMMCTPCEEQQCVICDQSQCYWCEEGFFGFDDKCVDHCQEGFFVDEESRDCEPCHRTCRTCGGPQYDDCDSCEEGFMLKSGECLEGRQLSSCTETHFTNSQGECELCHAACKTCSAAGKEDCNSCYSGRFLTSHQTCLPRCPSGTFANQASSRCEDCSKGCVMCQDAQQCQRCRSGLNLHNGVCVVDCQRGFSQGGVCQPCVPECASCQGNSSHCLSCEKQYLLLDRSCRSHCPEDYYATENRECIHCPAHCGECNQDGLCKKCAQYYFLHEGKCVDDCPNGYFASEKPQECVHCHADCASCDGPSFDDCDVCRNPKAVRYNGECLAKCPNSTYYDATTNECRDCDMSCQTCSGHQPSSCLSCDTHRRKDASGHCVWFIQCSLRSYMDHNGQCQQCHKLCHRCSGPGKDNCLSCNEPHFLMNNTCVQECSVGYYAEDKDKRVCERCHFSCKSCVGRHSLQCVNCKSGFFKQGSNCVETCSESHFGNTTTMVCEQCDPSCSQCGGRGNRNCLSCREDYVYLRRGGQCLLSCPPSFYQHSRSKTCHQCHPTCKTCSDKGALACQSCFEGYTFMGGICLSKCLVGYYATSQGSESESDEPNCKACDPSCIDCRGPSMSSCTVCPALQILLDGRCLSCCGNETRHDDQPIPRECCDCKASREECIIGVNFVMRDAEDMESQGSTAKLLVLACVVLILSVGGGFFLFLNARSKSLAIAPKTKAGGYEKLGTNGGIASQHHTSSFGEYSDRIIECEEDEEDDDDIVYMGKDGTVYRKFKYGLLDEDEIELEYDDESY
ncbi:proprotein convertase subtilisin/kexin type 5-like [Cyclopterus lumpus]|uniref:proprotein convertase subtilisin/kexin type 5-like n=1 Tax=Cyclopterus lumpus TaxID=8103 RepID=UPI001485D13E|nr:proprotein convertase subtilisin/kexin type 5-like [Cyclopterus lumpus]